MRALRNYAFIYIFIYWSKSEFHIKIYFFVPLRYLQELFLCWTSHVFKRVVCCPYILNAVVALKNAVSTMRDQFPPYPTGMLQPEGNLLMVSARNLVSSWLFIDQINWFDKLINWYFLKNHSIKTWIHTFNY